jgi:resolvase-like protein
MTRTVCLLRLSSRKQAKRDKEFKVQRATIQTWLDKEGISVAPEDWRCEAAVSGKTRHRPVLETILDEIERKEVGRVVCSDYTRAGRSGFRTNVMIEDVLDLGAEIVFVLDGLRLTARPRTKRQREMSPLTFVQFCTLAGLSLGAVAKLEIVGPSTAAACVNGYSRVGKNKWGRRPLSWPESADAEIRRQRAAGASALDIARSGLVVCSTSRGESRAVRSERTILKRLRELDKAAGRS